MASTINATTSSGIVTTADNTGQLQLQTTGVNAVTIDTSQNVGIGTTSPATKLQISGASGSLNARVNAGNTGLDVTNNDATGVTDLATSPLGAGGKVMTFTTYTGSASAERMRIDSSGNLLINNTTGTAYKLNVYAATNDGFNPINVRRTAATEGLLVNFQNPSGTQTGYIYNLASSTNYVTTSDYRLKENVVPMTGALNIVAQLKPVTWKWKIDGSNGQGFIAHELQEVVPDCVTGEKDALNEDGSIKPQGVDTSFLVATLTAAIQELKAELDELKAKVGK